MAETVGDFVARRLHEWGVRRIYGYPGDGINCITAGLRRLDSIEFVQVRHEETAAFAACAQIAIAQRTVTCVIVPGDLQEEPADAAVEPPHKHGYVHSGLGTADAYELPAEDDLERAAEILNESDRVAILVGQGALGAGAQVAEVAERLGGAWPRRCSARRCSPTRCPTSPERSGCSAPNRRGR
jgi:thiamine pyrophosphate-dependent acetolactate synthase large subunit-like protein